MIGIKNANGKYFCPWCCCDKDSRNEIQIDWNAPIYSRKWDGNTSVCKLCEEKTQKCRNNHDYKKENNLLKFPFTERNTVLDTLHTVLRTSDIMEKELKNRVQNYKLNGKLQQMANEKGNFFNLFCKQLTN